MNIDCRDFVDFVEYRCQSSISKLELLDTYSKFDKEFQESINKIYESLPKDSISLFITCMASLEEKHSIENAMYYKCGVVDGIEAKNESL